MSTSTPTDATTSTTVDTEVSGCYSGEYTWRIEDAITKLQLEAPTMARVDLKSPEFRVGPFTCTLLMEIGQQASYLGAFIQIVLKDSDILAAFGSFKIDVLDGKMSLINSYKGGNQKFKGTTGWGRKKIETAEAVLKRLQEINVQDRNLYVRVDVHVKAVPMQEGEPSAPGTELLSMLTDLHLKQEIESPSVETLDTAETATVSSSTSLESAGTRQLSFAHGRVKIRMPLVTTGEDRAQALQQNIACHQLLLEYPSKSFTWAPNLCPKDPSVTIHVEYNLLQHVPLIRSLQDVNVAEDPTGEDESVSIPFKPPASIHGIACALMLAEGTVTAQNIFTLSCGPKLALQTLWAASYLGHKKVEQVVTKWLYCVVLSMLAGEDSFIFGVIKDVKAAVDELKKSEKQWKKVFDLVPSVTLQTILDDLMALLPGDSLHSKVSNLPVAIIDQWIESCSGFLNMRSAAVPDVGCVLKLIERLPHHPEVEVLHIPKTEGGNLSTEDTVRVLAALDLVLPAMPKLRVLGLSNLLLTTQNINEVVSILSIVRFRLQGVALTICSNYGQPQDRVEAARVLFRALGKMAQLQTLRLEKWEEGIAKEHVAGLKSLKVMLPELPSAAYVERMAAEAPTLKLCTVPIF